MRPAKRLALAGVLLLLTVLPHVLAHDEGEGAASGMAMSHDHLPMTAAANAEREPAYWTFPEQVPTIYAHIVLMTIAWFGVLPIAVMFSIARSHLSLRFQLAFHFLNGVGLLLGCFYNWSTPDLYENNSHHKMGWAVTVISGAWTLLSCFRMFTRHEQKEAHLPSTQVTAQAMAHHHFRHVHKFHPYRWSHDSGQGTELNTESLASHSGNSDADELPARKPLAPQADAQEEDLEDQEARGFLHNTPVDRFLARYSYLTENKLGKCLIVLDVILERFIIPLGFVTFLTGIVTFSGIAKGGQIFTVLAHFIKGGIFFGYGLLTFGRWMGCFADFGWAWNLKPGADIVGRGKARIPSAEFTESFVICLYGASNVFLEHLSNWGKEWSPMDLEHVSITILFFGGGLLGMLIEPPRIRQLLAVALSSPYPDAAHAPKEWRQPKSHSHPLNPMPALVILLLGIMMSAHSQHSMIAGAIHKQWGTLFVFFAIARAVTYVTFWLKPPQSYLPQRPPSEVVASFCLVSGGLIFMASNAASVDALEMFNLDAMFVFTVMMGLTALIMAWALVVIMIKGWAVERQRKLQG